MNAMDERRERRRERSKRKEKRERGVVVLMFVCLPRVLSSTAGRKGTEVFRFVEGK
jgi:hypothetical protein